MLVTYFTKDVFRRPITIIQIVEYFAYGARGLRDVLRKFGLVKIFVRTGFNYFRRGPLDLCLDGRVYKHVIRDSKLDCSVFLIRLRLLLITRSIKVSYPGRLVVDNHVVELKKQIL